MTLGLSSYGSLNGLGLITGGTSGYGYGGYYGGFGNSKYTEYAKESITNSYDVSTTQQSFNNMQATQNNTLNANCQTIQDMLKNGRYDDALDTFNSTVNTLSKYGQYAGYSEEDIKNLIQQQYVTATSGSTLLGDVSKYGDSSFVSGLKASNPISVFLCQSASRNDLKAEITNKPASGSAIAGKIAGAAVGGAGFMIGANMLTTAKKGWNAARSVDATNTLGKKISKGLEEVGKKFFKSHGTGWKNSAFQKAWKPLIIAGAAIGLVCLGGKWLLDKFTSSNEV